MRRTRVFAERKPWRRGNSFAPSRLKSGAPAGCISRGVCGITFEKFQDIKEGDIVEAYLMEQIEV